MTGDAFTVQDDSGNVFLDRTNDGKIRLGVGSPAGYIEVSLSAADQDRITRFFQDQT